MGANTLPESRARVVRGVVRSATLGNLIPIYCANCGVEWGRIPEHHVTFAFALCDSCAEKHGAVAHTYEEPDNEFWARVQEAKTDSELSTLKREWDQKVRKF